MEVPGNDVGNGRRNLSLIGMILNFPFEIYL